MRPLLEPFYEIWTEPPHQLHPLLVHFPIVFLVLEAVFLLMFKFAKKPEYGRWAFIFLGWATASTVIVALAGLHDSGLNLGAGDKIWLGLQDRWANLFRFQSSVTVHAWLAAGLFLLTVLRLIWRTLGGSSALQGLRGWAYAIATLLSLWIMSAAGYVGGLLNHE